jgi:hypothetical protein
MDTIGELKTQLRHLRDIEHKLSRELAQTVCEIRQIAQAVDIVLAGLPPPPTDVRPLPSTYRSESPFAPKNLPAPPRGPRRSKSSIPIIAVYILYTYAKHRTDNFSQQPTNKGLDGVGR